MAKPKDKIEHPVRTALWLWPGLMGPFLAAAPFRSVSLWPIMAGGLLYTALLAIASVWLGFLLPRRWLPRVVFAQVVLMMTIGGSVLWGLLWMPETVSSQERSDWLVGILWLYGVAMVFGAGFGVWIWAKYVRRRGGTTGEVRGPDGVV